MRIAYSNLKKTQKYSAKNSSSIEINTSHYYIKFKPKNTDELKLLEADTTLILYDYPLDYEILQMGEYYHDPEVPKTKPTYHYASIKVGISLPRSIDYEILSNLYIPDEEDLPDSYDSSLVDESLRLTNNLNSNNFDNTTLSRRSKWRPAGRIQIWDDKIGQTTTSTKVFSHWEYYDCDNGDEFDELMERTNLKSLRRPIDEQCKRAVYKYITNRTNGSYIPIHGAKVRARRWFTTHTGITNSQGYYTTIFRGARLYYYGNMFGLTRPPSKKWGLRRLVINAQQKSGRSNYVKARRLILAADISLKAWGSPTDKVFGTTIHELAHAAHREVDRSAYNSLVWKGYTSPCTPSTESCDNPGLTGANARRLMETWASTVENFIVRERYENYYNVQGFNYTNGYNYLQRKTIALDN